MCNLENKGNTTYNHYLTNLVGLIYLGILCPQFKEAMEWRELGLRELWRELFKQVYTDGVSFEASISYNRLATEMFLSPIILCQMNAIPIPSKVLARLEKMLEFVMCYTKPDGTVTLIGDCDNGRLHRLNVWVNPEREWIDHRYLLAIGAVLYQRDDIAQAATGQFNGSFVNWMICSIDRMLLTGLCISKWIAQKMNVNTPTIDSILGWAQDVRGERLIERGKLVLYSDSLNQEFMSGVPSVDGFHSLEDTID